MSKEVVDESTRKLVQGEVMDDLEKRRTTATLDKKNTITLGEEH